MLVVFSHTFVPDTKIVFGHDLVTPLCVLNNSFKQKMEKKDYVLSCVKILL